MTTREIRDLSRRSDKLKSILFKRQRHDILSAVLVERQAKFPVLTANNIKEALSWQEARIQQVIELERILA